MTMYVSPKRSPQIGEQVQDLRLHRDVQGRHRLVEHEHARAPPRARARSRRAGADRPTARAAARRARLVAQADLLDELDDARRARRLRSRSVWKAHAPRRASAARSGAGRATCTGPGRRSAPRRAASCASLSDGRAGTGRRRAATRPARRRLEPDEHPRRSSSSRSRTRRRAPIAPPARDRERHVGRRRRRRSAAPRPKQPAASREVLGQALGRDERRALRLSSSRISEMRTQAERPLRGRRGERRRLLAPALAGGPAAAGVERAAAGGVEPRRGLARDHRQALAAALERRVARRAGPPCTGAGAGRRASAHGPLLDDPCRRTSRARGRRSPTASSRSCVMNSIERLRSRPQVIEDRHDLRLGGHVERGRRLVGDQQLGLGRQRAGDHHPLQHPARELVGIAAQVRARRRRSRPSAAARRACSRAAASVPR